MWSCPRTLNLIQTDFPLWDEPSEELPDDVEAFLQAGDPPIVFINLRGDYKNTFCKVEHLSNFGSGAPINEKEETDLTWTGCGLRFGNKDKD